MKDGLDTEKRLEKLMCGENGERKEKGDCGENRDCKENRNYKEKRDCGKSRNCKEKRNGKRGLEKVAVLPVTAFCLAGMVMAGAGILAGCGARTVIDRRVNETSQEADSLDETAAREKDAEKGMEESIEAAEDEGGEAEAADGTEADGLEENGAGADGAKADGTEAAGDAAVVIDRRQIQQMGKTVELMELCLENPSWDYYCSAAAADFGEKVSPLELVKISEETNQITDTEQWFSDNNLTVKTGESQDERYDCEILPGASGAEAYRIQITDRVNGDITIFNFENFRFADDFQESDRDFVEQRIWDAQVRNGILYLSMGHLTYAETSPHNAYVMAVSLSEKRLLWKSQPLVSNAGNFQIVNNVLLCGYGFTSEPDYIYQLDLGTGEELARTPVKSRADYLIVKNGILYVRTYNTNYEFQIK